MLLQDVKPRTRKKRTLARILAGPVSGTVTLRQELVSFVTYNVEALIRLYEPDVRSYIENFDLFCLSRLLTLSRLC